MNKRDIAIIVLNYNSWEDTLNEVFLLQKQFNFDWGQFVIIDNASENESAKELKKKELGDYIFIESNKNNGYASGNNIGLRYAFNNNYKYAWIINNDVYINDNTLLSKILNVFELDKDVAVANPDIYSPEGYLFNRDSQRMSFFDLTIGLFKYRKKGREIEDLGGYAYVYRPQGCCMFVDLEKMNKIDYLDENTFLYCEEIILAEKVLNRKWKCACVHSAKVIHNHSKTIRDTLSKSRVIKIKNKSFDYYLKQYRHFGVVKRKVCLFFFFLKNCLID